MSTEGIDSLILDGKLVAEYSFFLITRSVMKLISSEQLDPNLKPCLAIIHANDRQDSLSYIKRKIQAIERLGFLYKYYKYNIDQLKDIPDLIDSLNFDKSVHGIMIQSPIYETKSLGFDDLVYRILTCKDVDGLKDGSNFTSCTALAVLQILNHYKIPIKNQQILVVGRSKTVGEPIVRLLAKYGGIVTITHSGTDRILFNDLCKTSDIVVSAAGVPGVVDLSMVKNGATLIDVGISVVDGRVCGDFIHHTPNPPYRYTPVPGGVGPVTVSMLMHNLMTAYKTNHLHSVDNSLTSPSNEESPLGSMAFKV